MSRRFHPVLITVVGVLLVASSSIMARAAKKAPDPAAEAARTSARTRALVAREGRPAFVMTARLSVQASGTDEWLPCSYELRWTNPRHWTEEIRVGDASAVVRMRGARREDLRTVDPTIAGFDRLRRLMLSPAVRPILAPVHALERIKTKAGTTCFSEQLMALEISTCVDDATGAPRRWHLGTELYEFDAPTEFLGVNVPRTRQFTLDGDRLAKVLDVQIVEPGAPDSVVEANADTAEEATCVEADRPQFARHGLPQDHLLRMLGTLPSEPVVVAFLVEADGRLGEITVKRSSGSAEGDRTAVRWVKASLYAPATCDGHAVAQLVETVQSAKRRR